MSPLDVPLGLAAVIVGVSVLVVFVAGAAVLELWGRRR